MISEKEKTLLKKALLGHCINFDSKSLMDRDGNG